MISLASLRCALLLAAALPACIGSSDDNCAVTDPRGAITLQVYQGPWTGVVVVTTFQRQPDPRDAIRCMRRTVGPCAITQCTNVGVDFVNGGPSCSGANPGTLVVTRASAPSFQVNGSAQITLTTPLASGESLGLRTTGAVVPALSTSITVPQRTRVTAPDGLARGSGLQLHPRDGFTVSWTPTTSRVMVVVTTTNGGDSSAECAFDGNAGTGTVPAEALTATTGSVEVMTFEQAQLMVGAYPVTVRARWSTDARTLFSVE